MSLDRHQLDTPLNVGVIDLNGPAAFAHCGLAVRDYPGLVPSVDTAIAFAGEEPLVLQSWQRELHFHAELVVIVGRDMAAGKSEWVLDALLGYSLGMGIWDNTLVADLKNSVPRDVTLNQHYPYLIDGSRQQGQVILTPDELPPLEEVILTLHVPGQPPARFHQRNLLFDGRRLLRECNKLMGFCRGDVFCLGPSDAPVVVGPEARFPTGRVIRVEGPPFPPLAIPIEDRRDPANVPPWPGCKVDFIRRYPHLRLP